MMKKDNVENQERLVLEHLSRLVALRKEMGILRKMGENQDDAKQKRDLPRLSAMQYQKELLRRLQASLFSYLDESVYGQEEVLGPGDPHHADVTYKDLKNHQWYFCGKKIEDIDKLTSEEAKKYFAKHTDGVLEGKLLNFSQRQSEQLIKEIISNEDIVRFCDEKIKEFDERLAKNNVSEKERVFLEKSKKELMQEREDSKSILEVLYECYCFALAEEMRLEYAYASFKGQEMDPKKMAEFFIAEVKEMKAFVGQKQGEQKFTTGELYETIHRGEAVKGRIEAIKKQAEELYKKLSSLENKDKVLRKAVKGHSAMEELEIEIKGLASWEQKRQVKSTSKK